MKFIPETISEIQKFALTMMIFSTGGEDEKTLTETEAKEIGPNTYHLTYALDDPYDAFDAKVKVDQIMNEYGCSTKFHYTVYDSVYGDGGDFTIEPK